MATGEESASYIGITAHDLLTHGQGAVISGYSSRGIFLRLETPWVVFLSMESYRGPLTLNLIGSLGNPDSFKVGDKIDIYSDHIAIPSTRTVIHTSRARVWQAPPLPAPVLPMDSLKAALVSVVQAALLEQNPSLLGSSLVDLLGYDERSKQLGSSDVSHLVQLLQSLKENDTHAIFHACQKFLGLGTGLTPSGDDLILGLLLALNRWGHVLAPDLDVDALNQEFLALAYSRTALISANLIDCACQGQADERLILALDGIMTGEHNPAICASSLAEWGNTSGIDALVGMALTIQSSFQSVL